MGLMKDLSIELTEAVLGGDERARQELIGWGVPDALLGISSVLDSIVDYLNFGFSIVPQLPGKKQPCVRWKQYQQQRPHLADILDWYRRWPDAGVAVILGGVSNLFCIDVDGREAHAALVHQLGKTLRAPRVISGSGKPKRYHLFFQWPGFKTKSKSTPWHPNLEFRGDRGIVVLPPSMHKSGHRYRWAEGRSLNNLRLRQLPAKIIAALKEGL